MNIIEKQTSVPLFLSFSKQIHKSTFPKYFKIPISVLVAFIVFKNLNFVNYDNSESLELMVIQKCNIIKYNN